MAVLLRWHRSRRTRGSGTLDLAVLVAGALLAAGASSAAGLHQLLGALLFGYVWQRGRPQHKQGQAKGQEQGQRQEQEQEQGQAKGQGQEQADDPLDRIAPLGAKVLLPCFFLGFGQKLDLRAVEWSGGFLRLVLVLLLIAVAVKSVSCAVAGVLRGLPRPEWLRLAVLMNSRGLTEIVVLSVGYDAGLIDRTLLIALTLVALLTTGMAGPGLRLLDRHIPAGPAGTEVKQAAATPPPAAAGSAPHSARAPATARPERRSARS